MLHKLLRQVILTQTLTPDQESQINELMWQGELNEREERLLRRFLVDLETGVIHSTTRIA